METELTVLTAQVGDVVVIKIGDVESISYKAVIKAKNVKKNQIYVINHSSGMWWPMEHVSVTLVQRTGEKRLNKLMELAAHCEETQGA